MKIVKDWRRAHRWYSVHIMIVLAALPSVWHEIPDEWKAAVPPDILAILAGVMGVVGIIARLTVQGAQPDVESRQDDNQ